MKGDSFCKMYIYIYINIYTHVLGWAVRCRAIQLSVPLACFVPYDSAFFTDPIGVANGAIDANKMMCPESMALERYPSKKDSTTL